VFVVEYLLVQVRYCSSHKINVTVHSIVKSALYIQTTSSARLLYNHS